MADVPDFSLLPKVEGIPQGCAWGVFDKDGKKDAYGTLNHLTLSVVKSTYSELQEGVSVSLNWHLGALKPAGFKRAGLKHNFWNYKDTPFDIHAFDDEVEFNTQCSSQWDGLCHFVDQPSVRAYNGVAMSVDRLTQADSDGDLEQELPTINHWHKRGSLVARGVLLDYKRDHLITVKDIETIAMNQGVEFKKGDVIIIRSGFVEALDELSQEERQAKMSKHRSCGVESNVETAMWFWDHRFAAVAGNMLGFEAFPPKKSDESDAGTIDAKLHFYFLVMFGMPIGEFWDVKDLSQKCKELGRYSFVLTSALLNIHGAVASPPNALALF